MTDGGRTKEEPCAAFPMMISMHVVWCNHCAPLCRHKGSCVTHDNARTQYIHHIPDAFTLSYIHIHTHGMKYSDKTIFRKSLHLPIIDFGLSTNRRALLSTQSCTIGHDPLASFPTIPGYMYSISIHLSGGAEVFHIIVPWTHSLRTCHCHQAVLFTTLLPVWPLLHLPSAL